MLRSAFPALISCQVLGLLVSSAFLLSTLLFPSWIESQLQSFVLDRIKASAEIILQPIAASIGQDIIAAEVDRSELADAVAKATVADKCGSNCARVSLWGDLFDALSLNRVLGFQLGQTTVKDLLDQSYDRALAGLKGDLQRFCAVNALAFMLLLGLGLRHKTSNAPALALSFLLTLYTCWAAYDYVFGQNWVLTIVFQDWAAPAYQSGMALVALFLADLLFLRGRVTNLAMSAISSILP